MGPNERLIAIVGRLGVRPVVRLWLSALSPFNYRCFLRQDRRSDQGALPLKNQKMVQIRELATTGHAKRQNCRSKIAEFCGVLNRRIWPGMANSHNGGSVGVQIASSAR